MSNYKAIIAKIDSVQEIPNADKIQIAIVLGEAVVVSKDWGVGKVGVFFPTGTQLSHEFVKQNSLYRDSAKNANPDKTGFFDDNRKVRAQPFLKVRSEGFFAELTSLSFANPDMMKLKLGDSFETLNDFEICRKYINPETSKAFKDGTAPRQAKKNFAPNFEQHMNTGQFKHNLHRIQKGDLISIQSKVHGTSARYANTEITKTLELPLWKRLINMVIPVFQETVTEYDYVAGTRRVVLKNPDKEGFHGKEGYRFEVLEKLKPHLWPDMTVYGEIAGYANGKPIMPDHSVKALKDKKYTKKYGNTVRYSYGCMSSDYRFHVYRITHKSLIDGKTLELPQQALVEWCREKGFTPSYDLVEQFEFDGDMEKLSKLVEELTERPDVLTEDYHDPSQISEGVIIRVDKPEGGTVFLKNKSYAFKVMEGISTAVDPEELS